MVILFAGRQVAGD